MRWYLLVFIVFAVEIYLRAEAAPKADRLAKRGSYSKVQLQFQKDMQDAHNAKRKLHCAPALTIDDTVCQSAQKWADQLAKTDTFKHSSTDYGENIYTSSFLSDSTPVDGKHTLFIRNFSNKHIRFFFIISSKCNKSLV